MSTLRNQFPLAFASLVLALALPVCAQEFQINGQSSQPAAKQPAKKGQKPSKSAASAESSNGFGWGTSIEVGRMSRAASDALRRGNPAAAATYAKRAAEAAPQNNKLWFLYGYTARLAGRYGESISAYQRGLQGEPNSPDGLSGLAQTYARMGKEDEAKKLLQRVLASNPNRVNDLLVAGELFIKTGDTQTGMTYLQRAESQQPSAHAELLLATAYMKQKQPEKAKALLTKAKARDPKNVDIFRAVATYYREQQDYKAAIETLRSAPRMTAPVLADLAFSYEMSGDKANAAKTYARVANEQPKEIGYQLSAAQAYMRLNDMDQAQKYLSRARAIDADHYRVHAIQAAMLREEGKPQDAIREFNAAIARMPEVAPEGLLYPIQLRLNVAELYKQLGDDASAKQQIALAEQAISKMDVSGTATAEFLRVRASIKAGSNDYPGAEADLREAVKLDPENTNAALQLANVLWQQKKTDESKRIYTALLAKDPNNRYALEGLGYIAREQNDIRTAESYFLRLARAYPHEAGAYLALGDMYTQLYKYPQAEQYYEKAYKINPKSAVIVAGGANASIEDHKWDIAKTWISRANGPMLDDPRVMRERERYLFHTGDYLASAKLGYAVLDKLPRDRNASVYLAYDLYNLGRYDEVLNLVTRFEPILPREPNYPLLAGHVHKQYSLLDQAVDDYTRALEKDPKMVEAYVNRGYVLNDLQNSGRAIEDFAQALKLAPNNGVAQLGIAFSDLQLRRAGDALTHVETAEKILGESGPTHLAKATAYRQQRVLGKAEEEYRAALKFSPDDLGLHMALADTLYHARRYNDAIAELSNALRLSPDDPYIYAELAHSTAQLHKREETLQYVKLAEAQGSDYSGVLLSTGDALMTLGDTDAAMDRFTRALEAPDSDRVSARLEIARLFAHKNKFDDAKQQVSLAFAESRIGEAAPVTADDLVEAANIFLQAHDFDLAREYFTKAQQAGAADESVAIGLANTYLALGDDRNAEASLASLGNGAEFTGNYDYMLAQANVYRMRHQNLAALGMFARANAIAADDDVAQVQEQELAGETGARFFNDRWTTSSDVSMHGIFEDSTIYMLDAKLFGVSNNAALLPPPRSSRELLATTQYKYFPRNFVPIVSSFQLRNASGQVSLPSESLILDRNTYDTSFNTGLNPSFRLGNTRVNLNGGIQFTLRRDTKSPVELNQDLFRQFVYLDTGSFFNWVSVRASAFHEAGPFSKRDLSSRDLGAGIEFTVGHPWGRNALVTGWSTRDLLYHPLPREFYTTSTYAGLSHKFGNTFKLTALGEYVRAWRVQGITYAIAQAFAPGAEFEWKPTPSWSVEGKTSFERGMGFHSYDNVQSGFFISYVKPIHSTFRDGFGEVPVAYPIRLSFGVQQEQFLNFAGRNNSIFRPVIRLSLF